MIETSQEIKNISAAILKFQGLVEGVHKGAQNPHFRSTYANLETVVDTARPALQQVGVMFTQSAGEIIDGAVEMSTMLIHADSGEWMRATMQIPLGKRDPQGLGSAQTYAQRYSLMAILGLPPTDDDAESAIDRSQSRPEPERTAAPMSANQLRKDKVWEKVTAELDKDFLDCATETQWRTLKLSYRDTVSGWPQNWKDELNEKFNIKLESIRQERERQEANDDFPGDRPSLMQHPMAAG